MRGKRLHQGEGLACFKLMHVGGDRSGRGPSIFWPQKGTLLQHRVPSWTSPLWLNITTFRPEPKWDFYTTKRDDKHASRLYASPSRLPASPLGDYACICHCGWYLIKYDGRLTWIRYFKWERAGFRMSCGCNGFRHLILIDKFLEIL